MASRQAVNRALSTDHRRHLAAIWVHRCTPVTAAPPTCRWSAVPSLASARFTSVTSAICVWSAGDCQLSSDGRRDLAHLRHRHCHQPACLHVRELRCLRLSAHLCRTSPPPSHLSPVSSLSPPRASVTGITAATAATAATDERTTGSQSCAVSRTPPPSCCRPGASVHICDGGSTHLHILCNAITCGHCHRCRRRHHDRQSIVSCLSTAAAILLPSRCIAAHL